MSVTPKVRTLLASARRLTSLNRNAKTSTTQRPWQEDAWEMYNLVGEQRFAGRQRRWRSTRPTPATPRTRPTSSSR